MSNLRSDIEKLLYKEVTSFEAVSYEDLTDHLLELFNQAEVRARIDELTKLYEDDLHATQKDFNAGKPFRISLGEEGERVYEIIEDRTNQLSKSLKRRSREQD